MLAEAAVWREPFSSDNSLLAGKDTGICLIFSIEIVLERSYLPHSTGLALKNLKVASTHNREYPSALSGNQQTNLPRFRVLGGPCLVT